MERADVVVVGGGPAGSSLAFGLRASGLRVVVIDRRCFPRDKTCAGWITPQVLAELQVDPEIYAKERVLQPIHGFRVRRIGDREATARWPRVVSYGIRRCELDHFLLERCEAELRLGEPLRELVRGGDGWVVNGAWTAPLVVGAGGHFCPVARLLSDAGPEGEPLVAAQEVEFLLAPEQAAACPVDPELPELVFTEDLRGYGWVFRKAGWLNVGLGRQDKAHLSAHVDRFLDVLRGEGRLPPDLPRDFKGHAYLLYDQAPRRVVGDGLALVGDAAGLAYPRSGEGIRPAVESGLLLARALRDGRAAGRRPGDPEILARYRRDLEARFGPRRRRLGPTDFLPAPLARRLAGRLLGAPWFARRVVVERWFVHAHEPPL
jgi:flavin-dependent dehydrogenase